MSVRTLFEAPVTRFLQRNPHFGIVRDAVGAPHKRANPRELPADVRGWLTVRETAQYLRVGVDLIYDACAVGGLKHVKLGHRTIRLRRVWVDTWADEKAKQFR